MYKKTIESIFSDDFKNLVKNKLTEMAKDSGQSIKPEEAQHLVNRIIYLLKDKFKSTFWEDVCEAWDNGLIGQYGMSKQIVVNNLLSWIYKFKEKEKERNGVNQNNGSSTEYLTPDYHERFNSPVSEFLVYARIRLSIDINAIDPTHRPELTKTVSPVIVGLTDEYIVAKRNNKLIDFSNKLISRYAEA